MSNELRPYGKYKNIDLPWIECLPSHWEMTRNKNVLKLKKVTVGPNYKNYVLLSLTKQGVIARDMENAKGKFPKEFDTYQIVNKGNMIFCLFDIDETPRTVGLSFLEGMITGAYTVFDVEGINEKYLYYYYLSLDNNKKLKPLYTGLRKVINTDTFLRTKMPFPPRDEQDKIAKYLDYKVAKINKFIKAKKKLIAALREQIECYLFGNQNKPTSYEINSWSTAFPKDWVFIKASRLTEEVNIKNNVGSELLAVTQDRGVVYKKDCEQNYVSPSGDTSNLKLVRNGDYVISLRSFQGGIEFSEIEGIVSPAYNVFSLRKEYSSYEYKMYYKYLFKSKIFISVLNTLVSGIRDGKNINYSDFSAVLLPVPPKKIAEMICDLIEHYENVKRRFENDVILLNEYKASLISDVVTGKIDVRDIKIDELQNEAIEFEETEDEIIESEGDIEIKESGE